jgi:uncharacterized protein
VKIVDEFTVTAPLARTWSVIRDPQKVASCVPGCRSVETIDESHYRAVVASSVSVMTKLSLTPAGSDATRVAYESDVTMVGRLGNYGLGLMKKRAQTLGREFVANLQRRLDAELATAAADGG